MTKPLHRDGGSVRIYPTGLLSYPQRLHLSPHNRTMPQEKRRGGDTRREAAQAGRSARYRQERADDAATARLEAFVAAQRERRERDERVRARLADILRRLRNMETVARERLQARYQQEIEAGTVRPILRTFGIADSGEWRFWRELLAEFRLPEVIGSPAIVLYAHTYVYLVRPALAWRGH